MRVVPIVLIIVFFANGIWCEINIDNLGRYPPYLPTLTNEICTRRPDIPHLRLWRNGIKVIEYEALHGCKDVQNIWLELNHIKSLKSETFLYKDKLKEINLRNNELEYIEEDVFHNLPKLETLLLNCNKLFHFNAEHIKNVPALRSIFLDGNQVIDIDTDGIIRNAPSFNLITLNSTLIQCRLIDIARSLDSAEKRLDGMEYCEREYVHSDMELTRKYLSRFAAFFRTSNFKSYYCIPDDKWNTVAARARDDYEKVKSKYMLLEL